MTRVAPLTFSLLIAAVSLAQPADLALRTDLPNPDFSNNNLDLTLEVLTPPNLVVRGTPYFDGVMPGIEFPLKLEYYNAARTPALDTVLTIDAPNGFGIPPANCTVDGTRARCALGTVAPGSSQNAHPFSISVYAADASSSSLQYGVAIESHERDFKPDSNRVVVYVPTFHTFFVTNTNDAGSGSLRAVIEEANASCRLTNGVCAIAFRISSRPAGLWHTIRLASPLPAIRIRRLRFDATTQTNYYGDRNALGPEVELNGSALATGDGLHVIADCDDVIVRGLAINGFPGTGLVIERPSCYFARLSTISDHYIGCDPTGRRAVPNGVGLSVTGDRWIVRDNVIGGNRRSGLFIPRGYVQAYRNIIGLSPSLTMPLSNGASGIYVGDGGSHTQIIDNYIGFNHHFGIGISPLATFVGVFRNSLQANHQLGIDFGLDGVSTVEPVRMPTILGARFEDGVTSIDVATEQLTSRFELHLNFYANDAPDPSGYGEGQYFLGALDVTNRQAEPIVFRYEGDLRGKWVTATSTKINYPDDEGTNGYRPTTSEFSRAVEVK